MTFVNRHYLSDKTVTAHKAQTTSSELYLRKSFAIDQYSQKLGVGGEGMGMERGGGGRKFLKKL